MAKQSTEAPQGELSVSQFLSSKTALYLSSMNKKTISYFLLAAGFFLTSLHAYRLVSRPLVNAEVRKIEVVDGMCRRPVGRFEPCQRQQARVTYVHPDSNQLIEATLQAPGSYRFLPTVINYRVVISKSNPQVVEIPTLTAGWTNPLGVFMLGLILFLVSGPAKLVPRP